MKKKGPQRPRDCFVRHGDSERRIVSCLVGVITVGGAADRSRYLVDELHAVVRPDAITQVIKQFDDGEGLFRRPVGRNVEGR